jgi:serine/threonine protein kinase
VNLKINQIIIFNEDEINEDIKDLPEQIRKIIQKLLQKNPNQRYESAANVLDELDVNVDNSSYSLDISSKSKRKRDLIAVVFSFMVVAVVVVILLVNFGHTNNENPTPIDNLKTKPVETQLNKRNENGTEDQNKINTLKNAADEKPRETDSQQNKVVENGRENENNVVPITPPAVAKNGKLFIECYPWAEIYIDGVKKETTPLNSAISLQSGEHTLKLIHPDYPVYSAFIKIESDKTTNLSIVLDTLLAYLSCNVSPWGNVYINGELKGQTPIIAPIKLTPGENRITIKNPNYKNIDTVVNANRGDTLRLYFNMNR